MRLVRVMAFALVLYGCGVATGAGLLLTSKLPLHAIEIDLRDNTFRFKGIMPPAVGLPQ